MSISLDTTGRRSFGRCRPAEPHAIVTILDAALSRALDAAIPDEFRAIAVTSTGDATSALQCSGARVVLVSPSVLAIEPAAAIRQFVHRSFSTVVVAVMGDDWTTAYDSLLGLGACGVRHAVNLAEREGWNRLRSILDASLDDTTAEILSSLQRSLVDVSDDTKQFFATLARNALYSPTIRSVSDRLGVHPSTLSSRFHRAKLPPARTYLAMTRLLFAASYFAAPEVSIAAVALRLGCSSPQAFSRHVRTLLGVSAGEFRRNLSLATFLDHYRNCLILPYIETLRTFTPLGGPIPATKRYSAPRRPLMIAAENRVSA